MRTIGTDLAVAGLPSSGEDAFGGGQRDVRKRTDARRPFAGIGPGGAGPPLAQGR